MSLTEAEIADLYGRRAGNYDLTANLYDLIGFREYAYRHRAVEALTPWRGDTVVELGCGTGLNLPLLAGAVGNEGRVIGVDLTGAMLERAAARVHDARWDNVELVQATEPPTACAAEGVSSSSTSRSRSGLRNGSFVSPRP